MAEHGTVSQGEDRGHPTALSTQAAMADGVYAAVDPVQAATLGSTMNSALGQASAAQLAKCDDTVLASGDSGHLQIADGGLVPHTGTNPP